MSIPSFRSFMRTTLLAAALSPLGCASVQSSSADSKPATDSTKAANAKLQQVLPFNDRSDFDDAHRGFIAPLPAELIKAADGNAVWDPIPQRTIWTEMTRMHSMVWTVAPQSQAAHDAFTLGERFVQELANV